MFASLAATVDADDLARRRAIIDLRRDLAVRMGEMNDAAEATLSARADASLTREYRQRLSAFRSAVALHQTEWPAMLISDDRAAYLASAQRLEHQRGDFIGWARDQLLPAL